MDYYQLTVSLDECKVGHIPQVTTKVSLDNHNGSNQPEPGRISQAIGMLSEKAVLTDVLSSSMLDAYGILFNDRMKLLLEQAERASEESNIIFLPVLVLTNSQVHTQYWRLLSSRTDLEELDFQRSSISVMGKAHKKIMDYSPKSVNELRSMIEILKPPQFVSIDCPVFKPDCNKELIVLNFSEDRSGYYVSSDLMNRILTLGCSGLSFRPVRSSLEHYN